MENTTKYIKNKVILFLKNEDGQNMVEYGLIISLIVVLALPALMSVAESLYKLYSEHIAPKVLEALSKF